MTSDFTTLSCPPNPHWIVNPFANLTYPALALSLDATIAPLP